MYRANTTVSELDLSERPFSRRQVESAVLIPCKLLIFLPPFETLLPTSLRGNTIAATKSLYLFYEFVPRRRPPLLAQPTPPHPSHISSPGRSTSFIFLHLLSRMSLTEMEFPSRVAQKLIRLTRSLCSARSDKLLVGRVKGRLGSRKSCAVVSIRGWRAKGMLVLNGAAQDRAILRARDYKPLFLRHPLSQIYPSSTDTHSLYPSGSSFFVFLIRNFVTSSSLSFWFSLPLFLSLTPSLFLSFLFLQPSRFLSLSFFLASPKISSLRRLSPPRYTLSPRLDNRRSNCNILLAFIDAYFSGTMWPSNFNMQFPFHSRQPARAFCRMANVQVCRESWNLFEAHVHEMH